MKFNIQTQVINKSISKWRDFYFQVFFYELAYLHINTLLALERYNYDKNNTV